MTIAFAVFLFMHAAAHAVGFMNVSGVAKIEGTSGEATILLTGFEPGHWLMILMGGLWLLPLAGFVAAGVGVFTDAGWTRAVLIAATALSLLLCIIWAKDTIFGFIANAMVVAVMAIPAIGDRVLPSG